MCNSWCFLATVEDSYTTVGIVWDGGVKIKSVFDHIKCLQNSIVFLLVSPRPPATTTPTVLYLKRFKTNKEFCGNFPGAPPAVADIQPWTVPTLLPWVWSICCSQLQFCYKENKEAEQKATEISGATNLGQTEEPQSKHDFIVVSFSIFVVSCSRQASAFFDTSSQYTREHGFHSLLLHTWFIWWCHWCLSYFELQQHFMCLLYISGSQAWGALVALSSWLAVSWKNINKDLRTLRNRTTKTKK